MNSNIFCPKQKVKEFKLKCKFILDFLSRFIAIFYPQESPFILRGLGFLQVSTMASFSFGITACVLCSTDLMSMMVSEHPVVVVVVVVVVMVSLHFGRRISKQMC